MIATALATPGQFVPFGSPASSSGEPADASLNVKALPQDPAPPVFEALLGSPASPDLCPKPTITMQRTGDAVSSIRIQCGCGNVIELTCLHE
jgi:hypothetical protein